MEDKCFTQPYSEINLCYLKLFDSIEFSVAPLSPSEFHWWN